MRGDYTVPMPVSGGCPGFVPAMMGAAFAPIAVTGGMSILAYRGREEDETAGVTVKQTLGTFARPDCRDEGCIQFILI